MVNTDEEITFKKFKDILSKDDNSIIITISYVIKNIKFITASEYILGMLSAKDILYFKGDDGTELIIKSKAVTGIQTLGFEPLLNRDMYRMELNNNMELYISLGYQDITEDITNEN